ncbi:unnamed protein product, partial [Adineta ricciae]
LVTGGENSDGVVSTAELYNASANTWTNALSMIHQRSGHTATILQSGKVLVVGGWNRRERRPDTAELYDPQTVVWTATQNMICRRAHHTASLLTNGNVLITGGSRLCSTGMSRKTSELCDPIADAWIRTNDTNIDRTHHTATVLKDRSVLVTGGHDGGREFTELFDPLMNQWTMTGNMNFPRYAHSAVLLPNGKVLVTGGSYDTLMSSAELYDPSTDIWTITRNMKSARF